ncbi:MAG: hypothetical protein IJW46_07560, partial [Clostridia bacterium]|nr:hypothetical protein [Clostridia bacterium]
NSTAASGTGVSVSGGTLYVYSGGDGIDANSRSSYTGIVFSGGHSVIVATSGGNSAIDTEQGYQYTDGYVIAMMPSGGMTSEATHCQNFSSVGVSRSVSVSSGDYVSVTIESEALAVIRMPSSLSGRIIVLGSTEVTVTTESSVSVTADENGVWWK